MAVPHVCFKKKKAPDHFSLFSTLCEMSAFYVLPRQGISVSCWTPCVCRSPCAQSGKAFSGWFPRLKGRVLLAFFDVRTHFLLRVLCENNPPPCTASCVTCSWGGGADHLCSQCTGWTWRKSPGGPVNADQLSALVLQVVLTTEQH